MSHFLDKKKMPLYIVCVIYFNLYIFNNTNLFIYFTKNKGLTFYNQLPTTGHMFKYYV